MKRAAFAFCWLLALCACGGAPRETSTPFDFGETRETGSSLFAMRSSDGATASPGDASSSSDALDARADTKALSDGPSDAFLETGASLIDSPAKEDSDSTDATDSGASSDAGDASTAPTDAGDPDTGPPPCGNPGQPCCVRMGAPCNVDYVCAQGACY